MVEPGALSDAVERLRRPLEMAARDGFAHLEQVRDLDGTLRTAARHLNERLPPQSQPRFADWLRSIDRWPELPRLERERLVAMGLRLCAGSARQAG